MEKKIVGGRGININFIKLKPNQEIPMHRHSRLKYDYILQGSITEGRKEYSKGRLIANKKGSKHSLKAGKNGCELLVIFNSSKK